MDLGLSARSAASGQEVRRALQDYAQLINQQGGVLPGRRLEFRFLDNRGVADRSLENLRLLQSRSEIVAVIGGQEATLVSGQLVLSKPLLLAFGLHAGRPASAGQAAAGSPSDLRSDLMVFHVTPPIAEQLAQILREANGVRPGITRIGLVTSSDGYGRLCQDALVETLAQPLGLELALAERLPASGADFSGLWRAVGATKPDSLIWCASESQLSQWAAQSVSKRLDRSAQFEPSAQQRRPITVYGLLTLGNPMAVSSLSPSQALQLRWFVPRVSQPKPQSPQYQFAYHLVGELVAAMRQASSLAAPDLVKALQARESLGLAVQMAGSPSLLIQGSQ